MRTRTLFSLIPILSIAMLLSGCNPAARQPAGNTEPTPQEIIGGETDDHGCLSAAGYSWCPAKQKCLRTWEEPCEEEEASPERTASKEALEQVFREKYGKGEGEVVVSIQRLKGDYARGGVRFAPFDEPGGGGNFLAYRQGGAWKLAFDGNGGFPCTPLETLGFPADMREGCYEE